MDKNVILTKKIIIEKAYALFSEMAIAASNVFGCSSNVTIRLNEGCCLVFKILISFKVSEKNATSLPATRKEMIKRMKMMKTSMVVAAGVIAKKLIKIFFPGTMTE